MVDGGEDKRKSPGGSDADDGVATYTGLYKQWEEGHWSATGIDFSVDAKHWLERLTDIQKGSARWHHRLLLAGVETLSHAITALLDSATGRAQRSFLATQAADVARHEFLLDRFMREVIGRDCVDGDLTWGLEQLLAEIDRFADALRRKPREKPVMAQLVAVSHVVVEGVLAIPGNHFLYRYLDRHGLMPGLATGMAAAARDENRHVAFGTRYLADLLNSSRETRAATIEALDRAVPWMVGVFVPPGRDNSYVECFEFSLQDIYTFGVRSLEARLGQVGISPSELWLLARDDRTLSYEERGRRARVLVESGVLGDDVEPQVTPEGFEILFEGMARSTDLDTARSLGGPVEWAFTDAEPWHLVVTDDRVEAKPGRGGEPALRLEAASADWARMVVGRTDSRWALLTRRLRVHGTFAAKAKLAKLFH